MPEVLFEETMKEAANFVSNKDMGRTFNDAQRAAVQDLVYNSTYQGRRLRPHERAFRLEEAITTSDFPYMFGDILDRQLIAGYKAYASVWEQFCKQSTVKDFRTARRFTTYGGDSHLDRVGEKGEYLASPRDELYYDLSVLKYGRQFDMSWETMINDDLGALRDTPERFARACRHTEHRIMTTLYASDVGAHVEGNGGNLYAAGVPGAAGINCGATGTLALSIASLETAVEAMLAFTDQVGEPIFARPKYLVVGPSLEMTARQILTSSTKMWTDDAGGALVASPTNNVIGQYGLQLVVDPYLPIVNTGNDQFTQWYLFCDPADLASLEGAHLTGHEMPEICMKNSDKVSIGGGPISPFDGDFATDNVFYRVRHVFGGCKLDWRGTYMGGYQA